VAWYTLFTMKKLALPFSFVFVAGVAFAQGTAPAAQAPAKATTATPAAKTHPVKGEFVSSDGKTITIKLESGDNATAPLQGKALEQVKDLKAGQKVVMICKDDAAGKHEAAIAVKAVPATAAPAKK
jgi:hypothetical protein